MMHRMRAALCTSGVGVVVALLVVAAPRASATPFVQRVDHFNASDTRTWEQQYYVGDTSQMRPGGPIYFYCGAESPTGAWAAQPGALAGPEWAAATGGVAAAAEHRYFGASLPFGNASFTPEALATLTVEQAIADYAAIISYLRSTLPGAMDSPVVVYGGSYGGFVSAVLRMHYPDIVNASVASAAPVYQFGEVANSTWYDGVSDTFSQFGGGCAENITAEFTTLVSAWTNATVRATLQEELGLCEPVESLRDAAIVTYWAKNAFSEVVEFDYPRANPPTYVAYPAQATCAAVGSEGLLPVVRRATNFIYNVSSRPVPCFPYKRSTEHVHAAFAGLTSDPTVAASLAMGISMEEGPTSVSAVGDPLPIQYVPWNWLCCTEIVLPVAGQGIFVAPHPFQLGKLAQSCAATYGDTAKLDPEWHTRFAVEPLKTASNIVFVNGGVDPVRNFAPQKALSDAIIAVNIPGMAHTFDIFATKSNDPPAVLSGRKETFDYIKKWIGVETA